MPDISQLARIGGVDAERTATELFGIAVDDFSQGTLNPALRAAFGVPANPPVNRNDGSWYSTSYAAVLANSQFRPKLKFMFRVEFLFKPQVLAQFGAQVATWKDKFTFMIKSIDRPKVDFDYEEVNMYNFRTKVLKKITHKDLSMTFMDDVGNNVHEFFRFMMMVHSPITRRSVGSSQDITDAAARYGTGNGMLFSNDLGNTKDFANRGVMNSDIGNAIQAIKVTQMYISPGHGQSDLDNGAKEVSFFFVNPRLSSFDLDDMNHEESNPNLLTMMFDYDFMIMGEQRNLVATPPEKSLPPVGGSPSEPTPTGRGGQTNPEGGNDIYSKILGGVAGRAVQRITSETLGRQIRLIPGGGSFADTLGSLTGGFTRDRISGIASTVNQSSAGPSRAVVVDNSTAGADTASFQTSTGGFGTDQPTVA